MGKYIIELEDDVTLWGFLTDTDGEIAVTGVIKQPYTEPDLEAVKVEGRQEGYDDGFNCGHHLGYEEGLTHAWEAARKIIRMPEGDLLDLFDVYSSVCTPVQVMLKYDASEVIAKIKAWEDSKQKISVGDEVDMDGTTMVVLAVDESGIVSKLLESDGHTITWACPYNPPKTGRSFPEISTVLEKMREGQDD